MEIQSSYTSRKLPTGDSRRREGLRLREGGQRRVESSYGTPCDRRGFRIPRAKGRAFTVFFRSSEILQGARRSSWAGQCGASDRTSLSELQRFSQSVGSR